MASTSATPAAGPSTSPTPSSMNGQNQHPLLENNEEKNRSGFSSPIARIRFDIPEILISYSVVIKVGMVGDSQIGKTSLMVKYVEGSFDEDYIQTLGTYTAFLFKSVDLTKNLPKFVAGVNFMEKTISVRRTTITFSIWDLGGTYIRSFPNRCCYLDIVF